MKKLFTTFFLSAFIALFAQIGIDTSTPQHTLHVNGSVQLTNELNIGGGEETSGDPGEAGNILVSNGTNVPYWSDFKIPQTTYETAGTVIAVDGNYAIAQEIRVQQTANYNYPSSALNVATPILNLSTEIIDNEDAYTSTASGNSFFVKERGIYMVTMNLLIRNTVRNSTPVIGVWDNTDNKWIVRLDDVYVVDSSPTQRNQSFTLMTSTELLPTHVYSFRVSNTATLTVASVSSGTTGKGDVSSVNIKRLN